MSGADYAAYYCEENIWRLLSRQEFAGIDAYAVYIFGAAGRAAVCAQKAGERARFGLALWDYHVFALSGRGARPRALDYDSLLGFESDARDYLAASFGPLERFGPAMDPFRPLFRLVPAAEYRDRFDSDRSHMRRDDGSYEAPPPSWDRPAARLGCRPLALASLVDPLFRDETLPCGGRPISCAELRAFIGNGSAQ